MKLEKILASWRKKTITHEELGELLHADTDETLYEYVKTAVEAGYLEPVKASGWNGNRWFPCYLKYKITMKSDLTDVQNEIALLHPALLKTGYLSDKPEQYLKYRDRFRLLNTYLFSEEMEICISKKERSFAIFGEEKYLDDKAFRTVLDHAGMTPETLHYYETPEYCFNDYIPKRKARMTLLICENKDIWFNIRRRMYEDQTLILFDTAIDGVVYGCGNKVSEKGALAAYTKFMGTENIRYLYWGDIDRAGLNIYRSLVQNNPEVEIRLFVEAYRAMLKHAEGRMIPNSDDHRGIMGNYEEIYGLFQATEREDLERFIRENKRVPQEIISYESLLKYMR